VASASRIRQKANARGPWGTLNPNFGYPVSGGGASTASFQPPLSVRLGMRFDW
jgi:hypothetical protein